MIYISGSSLQFLSVTLPVMEIKPRLFYRVVKKVVLLKCVDIGLVTYMSIGEINIKPKMCNWVNEKTNEYSTIALLKTPSI